MLSDRARRLAHPAVLFLIVAVLAYGPLLPQMGFFWDELPMSWIRYELGPQAMTRYFSTNRPVWGLLYQMTTRLLPQVPIYWEIFGLLWRWIGAILVWAIAKSLWPARGQLAVVSGLCFLVYPGFNQQWTSYLYSHFFIVLCFLLASFLCTIWSIRNARWFWGLTFAGVALSALNLWMMEYFFVLELLRPFLILETLAVSNGRWLSASRTGRALLYWCPYLVVLIANVMWRLLVFNNQIYQPTLIPALRTEPISALTNLVESVAAQFYTVSITAWAQILHFPSLTKDGLRTAALYAIVVVLTVVAVFFFLVRRPAKEEDARRLWRPAALGLVAMFFAGGPFWLTGLEVTIGYPANRFTLPFMLGVSLLIAALLALIPHAPGRWLIAVLISLAAGRQLLWAEAYRHDWVAQKTMFWQMYWRAPAIAPHTMILLNEGALPYYADNSLTGALNWIYDPTNRSGGMDYVLFYPTSRVGGTLPALEAGLPVRYDFISEVFTGSTSQTIAFYYQPPGCLRLLDPEIDSGNHLIPDASMMREAAGLSSNAWILPEAVALMPSIYGPEPVHGWCYFFEQADLAAQRKDWQRVVTLGDEAFSQADYPNDPVERFVFIQGYAHEGDWSRALDLSSTSFRVSKVYIGPLLCRLWDRIVMQTDSTPQRAEALAKVKNMFACTGE